MSETLHNKTVAAEFALGSGEHFSYEKLLFENNIDFETIKRVEYGDTAVSVDIISFRVDGRHLKKAESIKKALMKERTSRGFAKPNPKYNRLALAGVIIVVLVWVIIFILGYHGIKLK